MLLRLVTIFAALCVLAGVLLLVAREFELALRIGAGAGVVLLAIGLHRFAVAEARLPKSRRRVLNMHAD